MASSSASFIKERTYQYDVFLSFSGEDTRKNFVDHLYDALQRHGIHTFKDDEKLKKGDSIGDQLLKSIEGSKLFIIVFSKKYASSSWCLNELVKIMECQKSDEQIVYPVFYDVDPSEVRKQSGPVGEALAKHTDIQIGKWKKAMTDAANLSGWDLRNIADGHEAKVVKLIIEQISLELRSTNGKLDDNLVGMEPRIQNLQNSFDINADEVRMIGIKGMGGAGKTTLAKATFDRISNDFEAKSFVENVREVSKTSLSGLLSLQKKILSDLLNGQGSKLSSVHDGTNMMKTKLRGRKVLVVLDDVDHKDQLDALAGNLSWFKSGSRIIITTRDEQVLKAHKVKWIHDVNLLSVEEAIGLFSWHAFGKHIPVHEYEKLSLQVVRYAAGLPLTIKVLGSFLCGKDKPEWIDALARLNTIPLRETLEKLELSFESLEDDYKEIFLDIACLLKGWEKKEAIRMLESCGFHARNGLRVLEQRSLITLRDSSTTGFDGTPNLYLSMHDHIEEMGKNIVRRLHPYDPNKHSRLWIQEEIEDVLDNDLDTEATSCIIQKLTPQIVLKGLGNMKKLRWLVIYNGYLARNCDGHVNIDEDSQYLPNALRYLSWDGYPHRCLPKAFRANNLVALKMRSSRIEHLWVEGKIMKKLNSIELCRSKLRALDLGLTPNLVRLDLQNCDDLVELHVPVGCLKRLVYLNLNYCTRLKSFSFIKELDSLEVLNLNGLHLKEFPDIIPSHSDSNLQKLHFWGNDIDYVPSSIGNLHKLVYLDLSCCKELKSLPGSICSLQHLKDLDLGGSGIEELPENIGQIECLEMLDLSRSKVKQLPKSFCKLEHLKTLILDDCEVDKLPEEFGQIESLNVLCLSNIKIRDFPSSIFKLKHLIKLSIAGWSELKKLPENLGDLNNLETLVLDDTLIREIPSSICNLKLLKWLIISRCYELENLPKNLGAIEGLEGLILEHTPIREIPSSICNLKFLKWLDIFSCDELNKLPENLGDLECLESLYLCYCSELKKLPDNLGDIESLQRLYLEGTSISYLPQSISLLKGLRIVGYEKRIDPDALLSEEQQCQQMSHPPKIIELNDEETTCDTGEKVE